jgi:hypothetical protein
MNITQANGLALVAHPMSTQIAIYNYIGLLTWIFMKDAMHMSPVPNSIEALKIQIHDPYNKWSRLCLLVLVHNWTTVETAAMF